MSVLSIKYICKYIHKGQDSAMYSISDKDDDDTKTKKLDEVKNYVNGRYRGSS